MVSFGFPAWRFANHPRWRARNSTSPQHAFLPVGISGTQLQIFMLSTGPGGAPHGPLAANVLAYYLENRTG